MKFINKNAAIIGISFLLGAIVMDYLNYMKAKDKGYSKIWGLFKHTAPATL